MSTIAVRRLRPGERRPVLDVFRGMSERSRRLRFHGPKPRLPEWELDHLVDVGCCGREAVVAVEAATDRAIGIARFVRESTDPGEAEIAVEVVDEWQGRGVGRRLLQGLVASAQQEGVERLRASVVPGNEAALAVVRGAGRVLSARFEDGVYELVVAVAPSQS
jgi:RimJ/RimL family protein N-acetyltransferase